jgi:uncharacterized membrane protein YgdD (TMEM256/DUF423 family)
MNWIAVGALLGGAGVALGAFGAHGLKAIVLPEDLEVWRTAVLYHLVHAPALVLYGLFLRGRTTRALAGWSMLVGTLLFSGSLYALVLTGVRGLGAITPFGGLLMILGWVLFARDAWRNRG